jgi:DtxR family Mn-dependent transcriptional regulator
MEDKKNRGITIRENSISESYQEYLECIYRLSLKNPAGWVKNKEISDRLNVKAPSVTNMLEKLAFAKLVEWKPRSGIRLTEKGRDMAKLMIGNHITLELFLMQVLKIPDRPTIEKLACDFEHHLTPEIQKKMEELLGIQDITHNVDNFILEDKFPEHILTQNLYTEIMIQKNLSILKDHFLKRYNNEADLAFFDQIIQEFINNIKNTN